MERSSDPVIAALVTWLLARDEQFRPPCVQITEYPPIQHADEWLGGVPLATWKLGDKTSRVIGECGFSRLGEGVYYKAYYVWSGLVGAEYLLKWKPASSSFDVRRLSVT